MGMGSRGVNVRWDGRAPSRLNQAYENARLGATSEFERLAEEEDGQ